MRRLLKAGLVALVAMLPIALSNTQLRATFCGYFLELTELAGVSGGVSLDYDATSDMLIASVNSPSPGAGKNFAAFDPDSGASTIYSNASGMPGKIALTTIRPNSGPTACSAGFVAGDVYASTGLPGGIVRIANAGATVTPFVTLPGETGIVTGVAHDRHCAIGGDLVAVTSVGNVWRITAAGDATLIVGVGRALEGLLVLPNNTNLYGPLAGRIVAGDEDHVTPLINGPKGRLFAIDGGGDVFTVGAAYGSYLNYPVSNPFDPSATAFNPHDIDIVPVAKPDGPDTGAFYTVDAGSGRILNADIQGALDTCECGNLLLTQEIARPFPSAGFPDTGLIVLKWSMLGGFEIEPVMLINQETAPVRLESSTFRGGDDCRTCRGVIGDFVWKDLNANGLQDPNEPGLAGVKVTLTQPATPGYSQTVLTDSTGHYQFTGLCLGSYVVTVTLPSGDTFTTVGVGGDPALDSNANGSTVTLANDDDSNLTIDFGVKGPGVIGNFVWSDLDNDGIQDGGEPGISGVTLRLRMGHNSAGPDIATTVTDGSGFYQFSNMNPGAYTVVVDPPAGYSASPTNVGSPATDSNPNPSNVTLTSASPVDTTVDFGFYNPPQFGRIIVKKITNPASDTTTQFTFVTTGSGYNGFALAGGGTNNSGNLQPGAYSVAETTPAGWTLTSAVCDQGQTPAAIALKANQTVTCTFTNTKKAALGDYVWVDNNSNGQQNGGEPGVPNVNVQLYSGVTLVTSTTTNASGLYLFPNLTPGIAYSVRFTLPSGYTFTSANVGADATDSDANTTTGQTGTYTLAPGETNLTVDAGLIAPPPQVGCVPTVFSFSGSSSLSGTAGNVRTFSVGNMAVKASAWSRVESNGTWGTAYLGLYPNGLGVTDGSESGSNDTHTVDNLGGRDNYILFEFNTPVLIDQAFLDYVGADSDISVWVGTKVDPYNNHLALSDALLGSLTTEENTTTSADPRWANINGASVVGNVVVIAALASDDSPADSFKLAKLDVDCTPPPPPACIPATFTFSGSSSTSGTAGNLRTFSVSGTSVRASAFSRAKSGGTWNTAYLGLFSPGLGVTDGSEGSGSNNAHKVDNSGSRENYVLFEFSQPVIVDQAFLTYIAGDSDMQAWVGTKTDPYNNHQTLSDAFLSSLIGETNAGTASADTRWANINGGSVLGNVLVIAAKTGETGDEFKINKLQISCVPPPPAPSCVATNFTFTGTSSTSGSAGNIRTFTSAGTSVKASAFSRTDSGSWNTAFLGAYSSGLGVTDGSEGSGGSNSHTVDNSGRDNFVLFEFSTAVKVDRAFLNYIGEDSDISVWIGTKANAYTNHLTLSDALLSTLATEVNTSSATDSRWADINGGGLVGNVLVIATKVGDTNDSFKLNKLETCK